MELSRAVLVAAGDDRHLEELERLANTLGIEVMGTLEQNRRDRISYIGKGKREELSALVSDSGADTVIADDELTASQARNLERESGAQVMDRTELIIRIFGDHARDKASQMEVEVAELKYRLPRLRGGSSYLSRLGGSGTTRGPGEQQLEYDRREIRRRIQQIDRRLRKEKTARENRNARRSHATVPKVTLVGYTNAGKTTILNALSGENKPVKDRLFETLDTTTRLAGNESGDTSRPDFLVTDTVGFIRKLPVQLVESFASTLEVTREADIIVICADAFSEELESELETVYQTLQQSGIESTETILCFNKWDLLSQGRRETLRRKYPEAVIVSAREDIRSLVEEIYAAIRRLRQTMRIFVPYSNHEYVAGLYGVAEIHDCRTTEEGTFLEVTVPERLVGRYRRYRIAS